MQRGSGLQGLVGLIPKTMADAADLSQHTLLISSEADFSPSKQIPGKH